jgi:hypothetical protein
MFTSITTSLRKRFCATMLVTTASMLMLLPASPAAAHSYMHTCECVEYIKHYYGLSGDVTGANSISAKDMGPGLRARGFVQVSRPQANAVVIFQPAYGSGANATHGHVARVRSFRESNAGKNWTLSLTSANFGDPTHKANNCNNLRNHDTRSFAKGLSSVSYYVKR